MKKLIVCILCFTMMLSLCSCKANEEEILEPAEFYYCRETIGYNSLEGVIAAETRESVHFAGDPQLLLESYLRGPRSEEMISPLPAGVKLLSYEKIDDTVFLLFSKEFSTLSGIRLSTACSCIVMTLYAYADVTQVCFQAKSGQLDNKDEVTMTISDIVLLDTMVEEG